jgi:serine/threonine protein phosphatase PrpC
MATVCSGLAMFARATTVAVIVTQISVQIVAPAMAVVILEEILGVTTTGDSRILAMEEGMTQTVVLIIAEVYQLENSNWLKRQQRLWRDNL